MTCPWCGSTSHSPKTWEYNYIRTKCDECHRYFWSDDGGKTFKKMLEATNGFHPNDYKKEVKKK